MKKILILMAAAIFVMSSVSAYAFNLPPGDWNAHFTNFSSIYGDPDGDGTYTGQQAGYIPTAGDYLKGIINLEQVVPKGGGLPVWNPTVTEQIAGYEYGLEFISMIGIAGSGTEKTYWGPVTESASKVMIWDRNPFAWNTGAGFAPQTGPAAVDGGPGAPSGVVAGIDDLAVLFLDLDILAHPDQAHGILGAMATLVMTGNILTGTGSGDMYLDAIGGYYEPFLQLALLGPAMMPADMYLKWSHNVNPPLYGWTVRSQDPADFVVPEPATILLLGSSLLGLGFFARRKKR